MEWRLRYRGAPADLSAWQAAMEALKGSSQAIIKAGRIQTTYLPGIKMLLFPDYSNTKLGSVTTGEPFCGDRVARGHSAYSHPAYNRQHFRWL
jgi:hypothetical protein